MIRKLIGPSMFVGLVTTMVVAVLFTVLSSARIAGGAAVSDRPASVRAVLVDGAPGRPAGAACPAAGP